MCERDQDWDRLINGLRTGDEQVVAEFYNQHGETLRAIAEKRMAAALQRRVSPSDVVQSAFRTFCRRAGEGRFQFEDSEKLWSLICAITLNKVRDQARFHLREKRGLAAEVHLDAGAQSGVSGFAFLAGRELPPDVAAEFADQLQALLESLDEEQQQVVQMKIDDQTNEEIAAALEMSERTVRRIVKRVRMKFDKMFSG